MKVTALAAALLMTGAANAATYDFSYTLTTGQILTAEIDGTLQADADTVVVNSIADVTLDGSERTIGFIASLIEVSSFGTLADPALSLSGTVLDFLACSTSACHQGFLFGDERYGPSIGPDSSTQFAATIQFGGVYEAFDPANYSLTATLAPIPLPAGLPLLIGGLGLLGLARKRAS